MPRTRRAATADDTARGDETNKVLVAVRVRPLNDAERGASAGGDAWRVDSRAATIAPGHARSRDAEVRRATRARSRALWSCVLCRLWRARQRQRQRQRRRRRRRHGRA